MKRQRVVNFDQVVSRLGQDRVTALLLEHNLVQDTEFVPQWEGYFDLTITALILSFVFSRPREAFVLLQVCKLWHKAFQTKTFWRKYMDKKYIIVPTKFAELFDPFHHLVWPNNMKISIFGNIYWSDSAGYIGISTMTNRLEWKLYTNCNSVKFGQLKTRACFQCNHEHSLFGKRIAYFLNGKKVTLNGTFCNECGVIQNHKTVETTISEPHREILFKLKGHSKFPYYKHTGTYDSPTFSFSGNFFLSNTGVNSFIQKGTLTVKDTGETFEVDTYQSKFWKTYIKGLKK
jgi:hypothetical protein